MPKFLIINIRFQGHTILKRLGIVSQLLHSLTKIFMCKAFCH